MKKIALLLFVTLLLGQSAFADDKNENWTADNDTIAVKMIGKVISAKKSPYVIVQYQDDNGMTAKEDGILISKQHVLMGAHSMCRYFDKLTSIKVIAGDQTINALQYDHLDSFDCYNPKCTTDDFLILTLEEKVKNNKTLPIVNLAKNIKKGKAVQIAGFGRPDENGIFGTLRQSKTKIARKQGKGFFFLQQYLGTYNYPLKEGSPAVTMKVPNKKKKMVNAIAGLAICAPLDKRGYKQDQIMTLQNKKTKAFINKITNKAAKFM